MKTMSKKIVTGTIAATFLLGGAGFLHISQANATTASTVESNNTHVTKDHGKRGYGINILSEVATIIGVDETAIKDGLRQGKTLVQLAQDKGIAEDVLLQKLTDAENQSIDAAVAAGKFTQAQAEKHKSGLADRLKNAVEKAGMDKDRREGRGHWEGFDGEKNIRAHVATILGVDETTIREGLQQGKTIALIAQEKGIAEDILLQKLTDAENQSIDAAIAAGKITQAEADQKKSRLAERLKKEVEETGHEDHHGKGRFGGQFGDPAALSQILGITREELAADLQAGQSLTEIAQAKGISQDDLISKVKDSMTDKIKQFVELKGNKDVEKHSSHKH